MTTHLYNFFSQSAWRRLIAALHSDRGSVSISFILCLPIFLTIVGIIVQLALLVNAKIMIDHALHVAARSAVTALPEHQFDAINRAVRLSLVPLCPQATTSVTQEATDVSDALSACGITVPASFAPRYTYATEAATVTWNPSATDYRQTAGQAVQVTLHYKFNLTVPIIGSASRVLLSTQKDTVAGVNGYFYDISSICTIETAHGRQASTDGNGWPQGMP